MEMFLKELGSASKILSDFQDMYEYENRLKTFTNWPFTENCKCTPENVSLKTDILTVPYFSGTAPEYEAIVKYIHVQEELWASAKPNFSWFSA